MKTVLISAIAFASLTGAALAQEPPVLTGNYDAAVLQNAANLDTRASSATALVTARHSISTERRDGIVTPDTPCMHGNYGAAVCDQVQFER